MKLIDRVDFELLREAGYDNLVIVYDNEQHFSYFLQVDEEEKKLPLSEFHKYVCHYNINPPKEANVRIYWTNKTSCSNDKGHIKHCK